MRPTWADIDLDAVIDNVAALRGHVAPAHVCAVVKADAYGHGAVEAAQAALDGGATWLAVALVDEGSVLRRAGIGAPVLVLSEPRPAEMADVVEMGLRPAIYTSQGLDALADASASAGVVTPVHILVDTGMRRVGVEPAQTLRFAQSVVANRHTEIEGVWTHCAVADELDNPFTDHQLDRFDAVVGELRAAAIDVPMVHTGNSAVAIAHPHGHFDMVRCGIATYGLSPSPQLEGRVQLRPALRLTSEVTLVKTVGAGETVSYGQAWTAAHETRIATVPIGYADGIRRRSGRAGAHVLIGGRQLPIVGNVTMDQLMVDCGDHSVEVGDEVVLIGVQGNLTITADTWAEWLDTINYEIVCDLESRVTRRYHSTKRP